MGKTLITGGTGLVGSSFVGEEYIKIGSEDCDLRDKKETEKFISNIEIDGIIHCAGKVGGVLDNTNYKGEFFYDNILINTNVIEAARKCNIKKFVCFLSTCIFPTEVDYPLRESKIHSGPPHHSNDAYAYSKRMAEVQIRAYREQYGLNYSCVIPCNIYGQNDNYNMLSGHVIPSLIHKCFLARENKIPLVVWGDGEPMREFIYNKDVGELSKWVLDNYSDQDPIILSTSIEIKLKDLVFVIAKLMKFKGEIIWDTSKPAGQLRKPSSNKKLKTYLPNFKFTQIEDGLEETINYFENNYENIKRK